MVEVHSHGPPPRVTMKRANQSSPVDITKLLMRSSFPPAGFLGGEKAGLSWDGLASHRRRVMPNWLNA
jgi:hypothetical protein